MSSVFKPSKPKDPPPPPEPPRTDETREATETDLRRARRKGRAAAIFTSPDGLKGNLGPIATRTLTGGQGNG